jgi:hypothetical protein
MHPGRGLSGGSRRGGGPSSAAWPSATRMHWAGRSAADLGSSWGNGTNASKPAPVGAGWARFSLAVCLVRTQVKIKSDAGRQRFKCRQSVRFRAVVGPAKRRCRHPARDPRARPGQGLSARTARCRREWRWRARVATTRSRARATVELPASPRAPHATTPVPVAAMILCNATSGRRVTTQMTTQISRTAARARPAAFALVTLGQTGVNVSTV